MRLNEKIIIMEKEVGLVPMACIITECKYKWNVKKSHCCEELPYLKNVNNKPFYIGLCALKIDEYFKK